MPKLKQEIQNNDSFSCVLLLFPGNGTEFYNKTLHFNSSSFHHHTVNGSSPTTAGFGHLNMNQSSDEKIHNFRAENQGESIREVSPFKDKQSTYFLKTKLVFKQSRL